MDVAWEWKGGPSAFYYISVNPEPWAIGPISVIKKNGKLIPTVAPNQQTQTYQKALAEALGELQPTRMEPIATLYFWFWREISEYKVGETAKKNRSNIADATNLQKATEDALQGILYDNDRINLNVGSSIMDQSDSATGAVLIFTSLLKIRPDIPPAVLEHIDTMKLAPKKEVSVEESWSQGPSAEDVF